MTTVYPVAATPWVGQNPNPAYSGIFIPQIWSGKLVEKFYAATVLAAISNTDDDLIAGSVPNIGVPLGLPPAAIPVRESQSGRFGQPVG